MHTAQGGGWVTVAPRDTAQQGNDSESASACILDLDFTSSQGAVT